MKRKVFLSLISMLLIWLPSCKVTDDLDATVSKNVDKAIEAIDDAIDQIEKMSKSWQDVLMDLEDELAEDVQSTIKNEVKDLLDGTIANLGAEIRCDADFIKLSVVNGLKQIKADILNEPFSLNPHVCHCLPEFIDMEKVQKGDLKIVSLKGFDFEAGILKATLEVPRGMINIDEKIDYPSKYTATINVSQIDLEVLQRAERIIIKNKEGVELHSIAVTKIPEPEKYYTYISDIHVMNLENNLKTTKLAALPAGYKYINVDLNKGAGGDYIYLCYKVKKAKPDAKPQDAITDITAIEYPVKTPFPPNCPPGYLVANPSKTINLNLNTKIKGDPYIYLCYKKGGRNTPITGLKVMATPKQTQSGFPNYKKVNLNLNKGNTGVMKTGYYIYLYYTTEKIFKTEENL